MLLSWSTDVILDVARSCYINKAGWCSDDLDGLVLVYRSSLRAGRLGKRRREGCHGVLMSFWM